MTFPAYTFEFPFFFALHGDGRGCAHTVDDAVCNVKKFSSGHREFWLRQLYIQEESRSVLFVTQRFSDLAFLLFFFFLWIYLPLLFPLSFLSFLFLSFSYLFLFVDFLFLLTQTFFWPVKNWPNTVYVMLIFRLFNSFSYCCVLLRSLTWLWPSSSFFD